MYQVCGNNVPCSDLEDQGVPTTRRMGHDICMLKLSRKPKAGCAEPIKMDDGTFWPYTYDRSVKPPVPKATVIGWGSYLPPELVTTYYGYTDWDFGPASTTLREVELNLYTPVECQQWYGRWTTDDPGYFLDDGSGELCAGLRDVDGEDACGGDSGGPLFVKIDCDPDYPCNPYILVGVVNWGAGAPPCGDKNYPGVYAHVGTFRQWMEDIINGGGGDVPGGGSGGVSEPPPPPPLPSPPPSPPGTCRCVDEADGCTTLQGVDVGEGGVFADNPYTPVRCGCSQHSDFFREMGEPPFCYLYDSFGCSQGFISQAYPPGNNGPDTSSPVYPPKWQNCDPNESPPPTRTPPPEEDVLSA